MRVCRPGLSGQHLDGVSDLRDHGVLLESVLAASGRGASRRCTTPATTCIILAEAAEALAKETGDPRFADYWRFILKDKADGVKVYMQRLLDSSTTTRGYKVDDILAGKYGEPGVALMLFRTYPRIPFYENIHDNMPFWTDTGRLNAYCDIPEAIQHGENFIVHREGPEATPYLPNVIVSTNPLVRPDDFGLAREAMHWDERTIRNIKLPWSEVREDARTRCGRHGYRFYLLTPKTRHRVHSSWSNVDWHIIWDSSFGDPYPARQAAAVLRRSSDCT